MEVETSSRVLLMADPLNPGEKNAVLTMDLAVTLPQTQRQLHESSAIFWQPTECPIQSIRALTKVLKVATKTIHLLPQYVEFKEFLVRPVGLLGRIRGPH